MYGLPPNVDVSFLVGATLMQVCVGENEVILNFDDDRSIMSAATICVTGPDAQRNMIEEARVAGAAVLNFLGSQIAHVAASSDGTLHIKWSTGGAIEFLDSWAQYESYTIRHGEILLVV